MGQKPFIAVPKVHIKDKTVGYFEIEVRSGTSLLAAVDNENDTFVNMCEFGGDGAGAGGGAGGADVITNIKVDKKVHSNMVRIKDGPFQPGKKYVAKWFDGEYGKSWWPSSIAVVSDPALRRGGGGTA